MTGKRVMIKSYYFLIYVLVFILFSSIISAYVQNVSSPGHGGDAVFIYVKGTNMDLQRAEYEGFLNNYSSSGMVYSINSSVEHLWNQIWVKVNGVESTLSQAMTNGGLCCRNCNQTLAYSTQPPNPGHYAKDVLIDVVISPDQLSCVSGTWNLVNTATSACAASTYSYFEFRGSEVPNALSICGQNCDICDHTLTSGSNFHPLFPSTYVSQPCIAPVGTQCPIQSCPASPNGTTYVYRCDGITPANCTFKRGSTREEKSLQQAIDDGDFCRASPNCSSYVSPGLYISKDNQGAMDVFSGYSSCLGKKPYPNWHLPSLEEMNLVYKNRANIPNLENCGSGSGNCSYWTFTGGTSWEPVLGVVSRYNTVTFPGGENILKISNSSSVSYVKCVSNKVICE